MSDPIRVLLVDDHPVVRDGLAAILDTQPDLLVVGAAASGSEAIKLIKAIQPDVVLLDLEMPGLDGVEVMRRIKADSPAVQAIVFTAFDTDERILSAVKAGAMGYLLKGSPREEIFRAIRVVSQGGSLLQPVVASRLLHQIASSPPEKTSLTARETEVLALLAQGKANKEIAKILMITERTVKFHVSSLLAKLGAENRTEAVSMAAKMGMVDL